MELTHLSDWEREDLRDEAGESDTKRLSLLDGGIECVEGDDEHEGLEDSENKGQHWSSMLTCNHHLVVRDHVQISANTPFWVPLCATCLWLHVGLVLFSCFFYHVF